MFDFPGVEIGVAEYPEGPTGCTVVHVPAGAAMAVDVRGGSAAVVGENYGWTHAICLAGGSIYGLEAVSGVAAELFARRGYSTAPGNLAVAAGAIVYDFTVRENAIYPDLALGRAALRFAQPGRFPLGGRGAGSSVTVGNGFGFGRDEPAGQGAAFRQLGAVKVAVCTVVNAMGVIVDRQGRVVRGNLDPETGTRTPIVDRIESLVRSLNDSGRPDLPGRNTTLTVVVTNRRLDHRQLRQFGRQVHASMARAIQPFHTPYDGDALFAVTTDEVESDELNELVLGVVASELAWDAVLSCFPADGPSSNTPAG
jgi:L-aminopeptidase/D-esterase-like protein